MQPQTSIAQDGVTQVPEFHQMADGMKKAITDFESADSSDLFAMIASYLAPVGDVAISGWKSCAGFVRRHPVESAVAAGALGLLAAYFLMPSNKTETVTRTRKTNAKSA